MASSFGTLFRISTFGESHGVGVGVVIDGVPARLPIDCDEIQTELDRRKPGQSRITTQRKEGDRVEILSGVHEGIALGTPIALLVRNEDHRSKDYDEMATKYRPSHADFGYDQKYGVRAPSGGGRASARETIGRVAAGAIAKTLLATLGVEIVAWTSSIGELTSEVDPLTVKTEAVDANIVRCPDYRAAERMLERIEAIRKDGNSIGGTIACVARGVPAGWGEPVFDKLEADLGKAVLSLPACKGFEVGSGFGGTLLTGREHNDAYASDESKRGNDGDEPLGRNSGGHLERYADPAPRRLQADRDDHVAPGHRHDGARSDDPPRARSARSLRPAPCRTDGGGHGRARARRPCASAESAERKLRPVRRSAERNLTLFGEVGLVLQHQPHRRESEHASDRSDETDDDENHQQAIPAAHTFVHRLKTTRGARGAPQ